MFSRLFRTLVFISYLDEYLLWSISPARSALLNYYIDDVALSSDAEKLSVKPRQYRLYFLYIALVVTGSSLPVHRPSFLRMEDGSRYGLFP